MATEHYCGKGWAEGPLKECRKHNTNGRKQPVFKSARTKRGLDKDGGTRGVQRPEGYIHRPEGG